MERIPALAAGSSSCRSGQMPDKDTFEREIKFYVVRRNNTELRHELYTNLRRYCTERIVHREGWQHKTSRYLMAHSII